MRKPEPDCLAPDRNSVGISDDFQDCFPVIIRDRQCLIVVFVYNGSDFFILSGLAERSPCNNVQGIILRHGGPDGFFQLRPYSSIEPVLDLRGHIRGKICLRKHFRNGIPVCIRNLMSPGIKIPGIIRRLYACAVACFDVCLLLFGHFRVITPVFRTPCGKMGRAKRVCDPIRSIGIRIVAY